MKNSEANKQISCAETIVTSPCRLHFGLFSLENRPESRVRSYGGLGAMIENPHVEVRVAEAAKFSCDGFDHETVRDVVARWLQNQTRFATEKTSCLPTCIDELSCQISVEAPAHHSGLGVGTQLAMSIATALNAHFDLPMPGASELALSLGRGRRSAVGSFGFAAGGMIVDGGREPASPFPDLAGRFDFPDEWRFVLLRPPFDHPFFGENEGNAFVDLPVADESTRNELSRIARDDVIPAMIEKDFQRFARSLGQFNRLSGELFAPVQGGPYNGPEITRIVESLGKSGFHGCGQSSWGPTIFIAVSDDDMAEQLMCKVPDIVGESVVMSSTKVNNRGFQLEKKG